MDISKMYTEWLKNNIKMHTINGHIEVQTPFLDNHNDYIHFYIKKENGKYIFTDNGYTINDLMMSGCNLTNAPNREKILEILTNSYGVKKDNDELIIEATEENLPMKIHMFLHSIMSVSNMFMLAEPNIKKIFFQDVKTFFDTNEIKYETDKKIKGASGLSHEIDIYIPSSNGRKNKLISITNTPTPKNIKPILYTLKDIKNNGNKYVIMNDIKQKISENVVNAVIHDGITPIFWKKKEDYLLEFTK